MSLSYIAWLLPLQILTYGPPPWPEIWHSLPSWKEKGKHLLDLMVISTTLYAQLSLYFEYLIKVGYIDSLPFYPFKIWIEIMGNSNPGPVTWISILFRRWHKYIFTPYNSWNKWGLRWSVIRIPCKERIMVNWPEIRINVVSGNFNLNSAKFCLPNITWSLNKYIFSLFV